jgi:hypothetical protein
MLTIEKLPKFLTPKAFNVHNPVQAAGAARGSANRYPQQNSYGVQPLAVSCCAPTEHRGVRCLIKPRAAHGVIHISRLRRDAVIGNAA